MIFAERLAIMEQEKRPEDSSHEATNGNGDDTGKPTDPRILRIAEAIGRHLAREYVKALYPKPANDNTPRRR